jgi:two-component system response regulator NreC
MQRPYARRWGASIGTPPNSEADDYGRRSPVTAGIVAMLMNDHDAHEPDPVADGDLTRVVIADDHAVVRAGLRLVLDAEDGIEVVAEVGDAEAAARAVLGHHPHVLVLDLNMPGEPSLEAIPKIVAQSPETAIVVLTMQQDLNFAREALRSGARGYVLKDSANAELVQAVRMAREGRTYLNPELGARMAAEPPPSGPPDGLTERELEVLRMIALGHTNTEIAGQLYLSVRTVESHRAHIQQKIRRSTRAELVRYALDHKLIEQGE